MHYDETRDVEKMAKMWIRIAVKLDKQLRRWHHFRVPPIKFRLKTISVDLSRQFSVELLQQQIQVFLEGAPTPIGECQPTIWPFFFSKTA